MQGEAFFIPEKHIGRLTNGMIGVVKIAYLTIAEFKFDYFSLVSEYDCQVGDF